MTIEISTNILQQIHANGEAAYPEEGAGLMLGVVDGERREVRAVLAVVNAREADARHNRYMITPEDMLRGERRADEMGLEIVGVFHSHPDHPNQPSDFDREWAVPWYSYVITSVAQGKAVQSRSWQLDEDRASFTEEIIELIDD